MCVHVFNHISRVQQANKSSVAYKNKVKANRESAQRKMSKQSNYEENRMKSSIKQRSKRIKTSNGVTLCWLAECFSLWREIKKSKVSRENSDQLLLKHEVNRKWNLIRPGPNCHGSILVFSASKLALKTLPDNGNGHLNGTTFLFPHYSKSQKTSVTMCVLKCLSTEKMHKQNLDHVGLFPTCVSYHSLWLARGN